MKIKQYIMWYKEFLILCKPFWKYGLYAGILSIFLSLISLPGPFLTKYAVDKVFPSKNIKLLNIIVLAILLLTIFRIISGFISNLSLFLFRTKLTIYLQIKLFKHMQNLDMKFHQNHNIGQRLSRLLNDSPRLQELMADVILDFLKNLLTFLVGIGALFSIHIKLALYSILLLPFYLYFISFFSPKIRKTSEKLQEEYSNIYHLFFENFYSIPLIKSFCLEKRQSIIAFERLMNTFSINLKLKKLSLFSSSIATFIGALGPFLLLYLGGMEIMRGNLTLGGFIAFNSFLGYIYGPAQSIMNINTSIQTSLASLKRVFEILKIPEEEKGRIKIKKIKGNILYEKINFSYNISDLLFKNLSFNIKECEKVLIMGKSGSGKTTLINVLLKFYTPQEGEIYIDGINLKNIDTYSLRKNIGVVFQTPFILSGTIKENLLIANPDANESQIMHALKIAELYDFVNSLPDKIDTEVGERGIKLSAGQGQRLVIARITLKNPDILIFDEATSHIDKETEKLIYEKILSHFEDRTIIFISHRIWSIINYVDRVFLLEDGRIKEINKEDYEVAFHADVYRDKV